MRRVHDAVVTVSRGVSAWSDGWPSYSLHLVEAVNPPSATSYDVYRLVETARGCSRVRNNIAACAAILAEEPSNANRNAIIDELGSFNITDMFYIDDMMTPTSSSAQACAVFHSCEMFTSEFGSNFNFGPTRLAILGPIGSEPCRLLGPSATYFDKIIPEVDSYRYLGVLLDIALYFEPHFKSMLVRG